MLIAFFEHDLKSSNPSFLSKILTLREVRDFFLNDSIYFWCSLINTHFGRLLQALSRVWRSKYPSKLFPAKIGSKNYKIKATSFFRLYKWKTRFPRTRLVVNNIWIHGLGPKKNALVLSVCAGYIEIPEKATEKNTELREELVFGGRPSRSSARVAEMVAHLPHNRSITRSNPARRTVFHFCSTFFVFFRKFWAFFFVSHMRARGLAIKKRGCSQ